jgi:hypothetical protein
LLPVEALRRLGTYKDTFLDGSHWSIPAEHADLLVDALRHHGYEPIQREDMLFR